MKKLDRQFIEDRALRDAARKNVLADVEVLKAGWNERGLAKRVAGRIGGGAQDVFDRASETAEDNRGVLSALIGAIVLWFASGALLDLFSEGELVTETNNDTDSGGAGGTENDAGVNGDESAPAPKDADETEQHLNLQVTGDRDEQD